MSLQQLGSAEQSQRIRVEMEAHPEGKHVKIRVEHHEERLGWYTARSLSLPIHQLPLLEQAVAEMRSCESSDQDDKIVYVPQSMFQSVG
jgi:hypothetical protein